MDKSNSISRAFNTLEELLTASDEKVRLEAARTILEWSEKHSLPDNSVQNGRAPKVRLIEFLPAHIAVRTYKAAIRALRQKPRWANVPKDTVIVPTVEDLLSLTARELREQKNFGDHSLTLLREHLAAFGLSLLDEPIKKPSPSASSANGPATGPGQ